MTEAAAAAPATGGWKRFVKPVITVVVFAALLFGLRRLLTTFDYDDVVAGFDRLPPTKIVLAALVLVAVYALYVVRERLAVDFAGHRDLGTRQVATASLISRSLSTLGVATVTGFALRLRIYQDYGLDTKAVGRLTLYNESLYYVGLVASFAVVLTLAPLPPMVGGGIDLPPLGWIGPAAAVLVAAYVVFSLRRTELIQIRSFILPPLSRIQLAAQVVLPVVDAFLSGLITWLLVPSTAGLGYLELTAIGLTANVVGSISQVPGGLGVYETTILAFIPQAAHPATLAALLVRRALVNLLPIAVGTVMLVGISLGGRVARRPNRMATMYARDALAIAAFAAAVLSLLAAAVPRQHGLTERFGPVAQAAVFAAGLLSMFAARGLQQGRRRAWRVSVALAAVRVAGAIASGPHVPSLVVALAIVALLALGQGLFPHPGPLFDGERTWWTAWLVALLGIAWVADSHPDTLSTELRARNTGLIVAAALVVGGLARRAFPARRRRRRRDQPDPPPST
ncbi:MAG: hypothetical protein R3B06_00610 [Kofleriaceae bacterium]